MGEVGLSTTEDIKEISSALLAIRKQVRPLKATAENPFFKSKYVNLTSILEVIDPLCTQNDLVLTQGCSFTIEGFALVNTLLIHAPSGQKLLNSCLLPVVKKDPQAVGSAFSYGRRYSLLSMFGLSQADDDGNASTGRHVESRPTRQHVPKAAATSTAPSAATSTGGPSEKQLKRMFAIMNKHGWSDQQLKSLIKAWRNIDSRSQLHWQDYKVLCDDIIPHHDYLSAVRELGLDTADAAPPAANAVTPGNTSGDASNAYALEDIPF